MHADEDDHDPQYGIVLGSVPDLLEYLRAEWAGDVLVAAGVVDPAGGVGEHQPLGLQHASQVLTSSPVTWRSVWYRVATSSRKGRAQSSRVRVVISGCARRRGPPWRSVSTQTCSSWRIGVGSSANWASMCRVRASGRSSTSSPSTMLRTSSTRRVGTLSSVRACTVLALIVSPGS